MSSGDINADVIFNMDRQRVGAGWITYVKGASDSVSICANAECTDAILTDSSNYESSGAAPFT